MTSTSIRTFKVNCTSQYEYARTYIAKDKDSNFGELVCEGGHYVRRNRWCECHPSEATWISLESIHPNGVNEARVEIPVESPDGKEIISFLSTHKGSYYSLAKKLESGEMVENQIPILIRRLMKEIGLHAMMKFGECDYTRDFYCFTMANLQVDPLRGSSFKPELDRL